MITTMILIMVKALDMMMGRSRFSVVGERSLTVGWQSLDRVSMNHLVCPLIPTSHHLPSQYRLKACKPQQVTGHQAHMGLEGVLNRKKTPIFFVDAK